MQTIINPKHNFLAVAAPGATDDRDAGYTEGSRWINVLTGIEHICVDANEGGAIWIPQPQAGIDSIAGLRFALGQPAAHNRFALHEDFAQRPLLAAAIDPSTAADPSQAEIDAIFAANKNFEVAGTNMTSALCTQNAARGGIRLTTAGAENDQAILQPRTNPAAGTRWGLGFTSDLRPIWFTSFRLPSVDLISFKAALALTGAHDLATDADQVGIWLDTSETESVVDDPNFRVITSINGTDVEVDTGIEAAADTEYLLELELLSDRKVKVSMNGAQVAITGALLTAKNLIPHMSLQALVGEARSFDVRHQHVSMLNAA